VTCVLERAARETDRAEGAGEVGEAGDEVYGGVGVSSSHFLRTRYCKLSGRQLKSSVIPRFLRKSWSIASVASSSEHDDDDDWLSLTGFIDRTGVV
jgi:hypothetical protein